MLVTKIPVCSLRRTFGSATYNLVVKNILKVTQRTHKMTQKKFILLFILTLNKTKTMFWYYICLSYFSNNAWGV